RRLSLHVALPISSLPSVGGSHRRRRRECIGGLVAREFRLPDIGEGLTEAEIVRWLVPEGGHVDQDQPVVEVETDKAVVEIPSPYAGTVMRHGGPEGATIAVGEVLVVIGEPGESDPPSQPEGAATAAPREAPAPEPAPIPATLPLVGTISEEAEALDPPMAGSGQEVKALPVVRKLARDHGVDLATVRGTGPGGRVTREDVER